MKKQQNEGRFVLNKPINYGYDIRTAAIKAASSQPRVKTSRPPAIIILPELRQEVVHCARTRYPIAFALQLLGN